MNAPSVPSEPQVPSDPGWLRLLARLPLPVWRAAGMLLGALLYVGARARRRVVHTNLALCFPQASAAQRRRWAWQSFQYFAQALLDRVWLWHGPSELVARRVRLEGDWQSLRQAGPVLLFLPHFAGLDAAGTRLTQAIDRPWAAMYATQSRPWLDGWVRRGRQRFHAPRLIARRDGVRALVRALRDGSATFVLPDMDLGWESAVFVPLFGVPAATVTTLPRLAALTQAPVRTVAVTLETQGYRVRVEPPWTDFPSGDIARDTRRMNAVLEALISGHPGQYHWLHRRFKTRPSGQPSVYG